jgi:predicted MPP superfamily phosphohydrolase
MEYRSETDTLPFTVTYRSAAARTPPQQEVLENRFFHKLFLITHVPASWPGWKLAISLVIVALAVWGVWWLFGQPGLAAAGIYLFFGGTDWLLLWWLPRSGRSFGPIGPQLFVKTVPRFGAAVLAAFIGWLTGSFSVAIVSLVLLQLLGSLVYLWGTLHEPFALNMTFKNLRYPILPAGTPPLRLLHLSDLHIERLTRRESTRLLELVEQARPDLIVITGDYLNLSYVDDPTARVEARKVLAQFKAPYGVYATLGSPPVDPRDTTPSLFDDLDIRLLRDELALITFADGRKLALLGLDCEHDLASDASAFEPLVGLAPTDAVRVLLYHSPELMPLVQQHPVDLYLCGHTHGGQVRFPIYGAVVTSSATGKRYEMGGYSEQDTLLYVSRGIGLEGLSAPRMRLFCPPEIVLFTLSGDNGSTPLGPPFRANGDG